MAIKSITRKRLARAMNDPTAATEAVNAVEAANTYVEGVTPGTAVASKAIILDASKRVAGVDNILLAQGAPAEIADGNTAITMANLLAKILTMNSSTSGRSPTVPTGTAVNEVLAIDTAIDWSFLNIGNQTVTISVATGHTLIGSMAIPTVTKGRFRTRCSAANTAITYRLA
jgi:hypothetical protein